jgi:CspA family cold shock protein
MSKKIIISIAIGIFAYIAIGLVQFQTLVIPASIADFTSLLIIIAAIFGNTFLIGRVVSPRAGESSDLESGTVKWFNVKKGYGFITRDQGDDVFVHFRNIEGGGRRGINEGQRVSFIVITGDKGLQADEVTTI